MNICKSISELKKSLSLSTKRVLVPTMGALHAGHCSLISKARQIAGAEGQVIVSIFVNPTQFDRKEDLDSYPNTMKADAQLCELSGADIIFAPTASDMYFNNRSIAISEVSLSNTLCGATRPGHFDGVCLVVNKLFNLSQATHAIFGEKDFQQLAIVKQMVRDLNMPVEIIAGDTVREASGLAMSSRNMNLTEENRELAPEVYKALTTARQNCLEGEQSSIKLLKFTRATLESLPNHPRIDYLEIVDENTLQAITNTNAGTPVMAIAIFFGDVRLIDHIHLH